MCYLPWGSMLFAAWILGIGLLCTLVEAPWTTFTCTRDAVNWKQGSCVLQYHSLEADRQDSWTLDQIRGVSFDEGKTQKNVTFYESYLVTSQGSQAFLSLYSYDVAKAQNQVKQIQDFLDHSYQLNLKIQEDQRPSFRIGGLLFLALGIGVVLTYGRIEILRLNRQTGRLTLKRYSPFGIETFDRSLQQITEIRVQETGITWGNKKHRVLIGMKGDALWFCPAYPMFSSRGFRERSAQKIRQFIDADH